jgi:hypothetical protein
MRTGNEYEIKVCHSTGIISIRLDAATVALTLMNMIEVGMKKNPSQKVFSMREKKSRRFLLFPDDEKNVIMQE